MSLVIDPFGLIWKTSMIVSLGPDADVLGSSSLMAQEDCDGHWVDPLSVTNDHNEVAKLSSPLCTIATLSYWDWIEVLNSIACAKLGTTLNWSSHFSIAESSGSEIWQNSCTNIHGVVQVLVVTSCECSRDCTSCEYSRDCSKDFMPLS
jgi:hypothetical protein